jgi:hypothetical protein
MSRDDNSNSTISESTEEEDAIGLELPGDIFTIFREPKPLTTAQERKFVKNITTIDTVYASKFVFNGSLFLPDPGTNLRTGHVHIHNFIKEYPKFSPLHDSMHEFFGTNTIEILSSYMWNNNKNVSEAAALQLHFLKGYYNKNYLSYLRDSLISDISEDNIGLLIKFLKHLVSV